MHIYAHPWKTSLFILLGGIALRMALKTTF